MLTPPAALAQPSVVTGVVFDSLRMVPLAGVTVQLARTPFATRTGADGRYRLVTQVRGRRTVTLSEPRLDRLMGTVSGEVELAAGTEARFDFSIPRLPPAPAALCADSPPESRTGAVVGVVRDSATGLPISGAPVAAYWKSDTPDSAGVRKGFRVESGEDGGFLICRLPVDRAVSLLSQIPGREILLDGLRPGADSILDLDLLVRPAAETSALGRLRGRVVDSATGAALAGADIMLLTSGLHGQSNAAGEFAIEQVLPGPTGVVVRGIGYQPEFLEAVLEAGATATVSVRLRPAPFRLEDLETRIATIEYEGFQDRMRLGTGKYWDAEEIRRYDGGSITALLGRKATFREERGVLLNFSRNRKCPIPVVENGILQPPGVATFIRPERLDAIEYYSGPAQVPMEFQSLARRANGFGCGLLVIWSRGLK
ncbi:MAG TPA: carboxypeptidase regulatory-like domain-containing protein [Gemmatimonadales bacterium]|nr:carboxypeptidase regulatory-like domain-containing protein [Gemmatimonadales bacterium]